MSKGSTERCDKLTSPQRKAKEGEAYNTEPTEQRGKPTIKTVARKHTHTDTYNTETHTLMQNALSRKTHSHAKTQSS